MRVRFTADFDWKQPGFTIAFKKGMVENVRRICGDEAIAAGKAELAGKREATADGEKPSAGAMRQKVYFQRRVEVEDDFGNTVADFQTIFTDAAEFIPLRGGEGVQAARLTGIQPYIVRVRSSTASRAVGADWQIVDARSGVVYAITAPPTNQDQKNAWLDIMVTQGRAS